MNFNLYSLKIFCMVVEKKSFSKAASALYLTQPAVSLQIKSLEEYFGTHLLNRKREIGLTRSGEILYRYAKKIFGLFRGLEQEISYCDRGSKLHFNIGACVVPGEYMLPKIVAAFQSKNPNAKIFLEVSKSSVIVEHILDGTLHLGWICNPASAKNKRLVIEEFGREPLLLIAPPSYSEVGAQKISLHDLMKVRFIIKDDDCGSRIGLDEYLQKNNVKLEEFKNIMTVNDYGAIKKMVEEGMGIAIVPKRAVARELELGTVKQIELRDGNLRQKYYLVYDPKKIKHFGIDKFLIFLKGHDL